MKLRIYIYLIGLLLLVTLSGCGGGAHTSSPPQAVKGNVALAITWPAPAASHILANSKLVPAAAQSIVVALFLNGKNIASQTVTRPASGNTSAFSFSNVPTVSVLMSASAYPSDNGTGTPLATASSTIQVAIGKTTQASLTMDSTIDHAAITPANPTVAVGATTLLTFTAYDKTGAVVLTTPSNVQWTSSDTAEATVDTATGVVTGISSGSVNVIVKDLESGITSQISINVTSHTQTSAFVEGSVISFRHSDPKQIVNLTSTSDDDWRQWGGSDPAQTYLSYNNSMTERKATGPNLISGLTFNGAASLFPYSAYSSNFLVNWNDGSPDLSDANNQRFVYARDITFTVKSDQSVKELKLWTAQYGAEGKIVAEIVSSSGSVLATYSNTLNRAGISDPAFPDHAFGVWTIDFQSSQPKSNLRVHWVSLNESYENSNVGLQCALLKSLG